MSLPSTLPVRGTEASLGEVLALVWRQRLFVVVGASAGFLIGLAAIWLCVPRYRAVMLVSPAAQIVRAGSAALTGEYDYAILPYVAKPLDQSAAADFTRFEKIATGRSVAAILFRDSRIRDGVAQDRRLRLAGGRALDSPALLADYLADHVRMEPVGATELRQISYDHPDPAFAEFLLRMVHAAADGTVRTQARQVSGARMRYLEAAMAANPNPDHRRALTALLMREEEVSMLIAMGQPYAAAPTEPPAASARPVWPQRPLFLGVFTLLGAGAGLLCGVGLSRRTGLLRGRGEFA